MCGGVSKLGYDAFVPLRQGLHSPIQMPWENGHSSCSSSIYEKHSQCWVDCCALAHLLHFQLAAVEIEWSGFGGLYGYEAMEWNLHVNWVSSDHICVRPLIGSCRKEVNKTVAGNSNEMCILMKGSGSHCSRSDTYEYILVDLALILMYSMGCP